MTTLVTGATGFVGNNVVRLLIGRRPVRVLVRKNCDPRPLMGLDVEIAHGDVRDMASVRDAFTGVTAVVHAAAQVHIGWTGLDLQRAINVEGTRNVATAALEVGARMVHVSSVDALGAGSPTQSADEEFSVVAKIPSSYVVSKRESEAVFQEMVSRGLHGMIVNPSFMLGPWDWKPSSGRMLLEVARRFTPLAPAGGSSVCDVRDAAAAILVALERGVPGRRYVLGGENLTYYELWKMIARLTGTRPPMGVAGPVVSRAAGLFGDLMTKLTGREPDVNSASVGLSNLFHYYDSTRAQRELGYVYRPAEETVVDTWHWFQAEGYV